MAGHVLPGEKGALLSRTLGFDSRNESEVTVISFNARLGALRTSVRRIAVVLFSAITVVGIFSAPAQAASWSSSLSGVAPGYESRQWYAPSSSTGTKITFTGCTGFNSVVNVTLYKAVTALPDTGYVRAAFTQCFTGSSSTSTGNWSDHGAGDYYFVVNDGGGASVSVRSLTVTY
ncbi:hypothetical protein [Streptomyces fulvorobeus]|uniref:Uncharacterized protein n=1 Tax=Streptomyces fulvorobeus TaxID=284028 RepID=A0A7J0C574_9ACTN|nr:hypothetical protein [Streptomyces fulvorobeus]NYE41191.1 hypothetical protein [Streptomyces fulvorobeus]GFM97528.1 hypothetical protein Sfulv_23390 [Streptomyces fulvorobeus]